MNRFIKYFTRCECSKICPYYNKSEVCETSNRFFGVDAGFCGRQREYWKNTN